MNLTNAAADRDPVCGMTVEAAATETAVVGGRTVRFCSAHCHATFAETPERYLAAMRSG